MHVNDLCPPQHLEAADLCGKDVIVTIKSFSHHEVGAKKEVKGVVFFEEFKRSMVLNRTNAGRIAKLYGVDTDKWIGKKITLYESEASLAGNTVPCIRVREKAPEADKT